MLSIRVQINVSLRLFSISKLLLSMPKTVSFCSDGLSRTITNCGSMEEPGGHFGDVTESLNNAIHNQYGELSHHTGLFAENVLYAKLLW